MNCTYDLCAEQEYQSCLVIHLSIKTLRQTKQYLYVTRFRDTFSAHRDTFADRVDLQCLFGKARDLPHHNYFNIKLYRWNHFHGQLA